MERLQNSVDFKKDALATVMSANDIYTQSTSISNSPDLRKRLHSVSLDISKL